MDESPSERKTNHAVADVVITRNGVTKQSSELDRPARLRQARDDKASVMHAGWNDGEGKDGVEAVASDSPTKAGGSCRVGPCGRTERGMRRNVYAARPQGPALQFEG